jgi:hypothetical protein
MMAMLSFCASGWRIGSTITSGSRRSTVNSTDSGSVSSGGRTSPVQLARGQRFDLADGRHLLQGQLHARILLAIAVDDGRKQRRQRRGKVKPTRSSPASPRSARRAVCIACSDKASTARIVEEQLARFRQPHPALAALQQLSAHFGFQLLDLVAQRRLADVQALGRAGKA